MIFKEFLNQYRGCYEKHTSEIDFNDNNAWLAFTVFFRREKGHTNWTDNEIELSRNDDDTLEFAKWLSKQYPKQVAYVISSVEEYGKLMAYCIEHDISIFRTYWDERKCGCRAYIPDFKDKRCYYVDIEHRFSDDEYEFVRPIFEVNEYGKYVIRKGDIVKLQS